MQLKTQLLLLTSGVTDIEGCMKWAFGNSWRKLNVNRIVYEWNRRHKKIIQFQTSTDVDWIIKKIAQLYLSQKEKKREKMYGLVVR